MFLGLLLEPAAVAWRGDQGRCILVLSLHRKRTNRDVCTFYASLTRRDVSSCTKHVWSVVESCCQGHSRIACFTALQSMFWPHVVSYLSWLFAVLLKGPVWYKVLCNFIEFWCNVVQCCNAHVHWCIMQIAPYVLMLCSLIKIIRPPVMCLASGLLSLSLVVFVSIWKTSGFVLAVLVLNTQHGSPITADK